MEYKEKYTISEATKLLGFKSRSTINKRTKSSGNDSISVTLDEQGNKVIAFVELQRAFPDRVKRILKNTDGIQEIQRTKAHKNTAKNTTNTGRFEQKVEDLEEQLHYEKAERLRERQEFKEREQKSEHREEHLRTQVSELVNTLAQQTRLLEDKQNKTPQTNEESKEVNPATTPSKQLNLTSTGQNFASSNAIFWIGLILLLMMALILWMVVTHQDKNSVEPIKVEKEPIVVPQFVPSYPSSPRP